MEDDNNIMSNPIGYHQSNKKKAKVDSDTGAEIKMFKTKKNIDPDTEADDFMSGFIGQYQARTKNAKVASESEAAEVRKKVLELFGDQRKARNQYNEKLFKSFSEIISQIEADYDVMKENDQKLEQLSVSFMKCLRQATVALKEKAKALDEIHSSEKQFDEMEANHMEEQKNLMDKLDYDIKKLRDKLDKQSKRNAWEVMRRKISHVMQNDD